MTRLAQVWRGESDDEYNAATISLWRAASLEEEWQADLWGRDPQAEDRRQKRQDAFLSAFEWMQLLRR